MIKHGFLETVETVRFVDDCSIWVPIYSSWISIDFPSSMTPWDPGMTPWDPRQRQSTAVVTQTSSPYWADMLDMTIRPLDEKDIIGRLVEYS